MQAVLSGNIEIIKFLLGDVDEERNKKVGKIYSMNRKSKPEQSLMVAKAVVLNARLGWSKRAVCTLKTFISYGDLVTLAPLGCEILL